MQPTPEPSVSGSQSIQLQPLEETYQPPPQNVGSAPFAILVKLFEKLQLERKQDRRRKCLEVWLNHWRQEKGYDLYPVLRLILPQKDRERAVYGLKEKNLAKTYIKLIPLGMRDPDAIRLLNWKKPTEKDKISGDFPTVLYEVVSKRSSVIEGSLSIDDVNEILDELAENMGKQDTQSKILQRVYSHSTAEEQKWIARIILKDMIISVKETTVFTVFHPDAQDLYNTCSDLKQVVWKLWDPALRLNAEEKTVRLFHAFAPMLCKRPTRKIEETVKEMHGAEFFIEEKLDGERMQLHKRGNEKGKDYTYLYGSHVGTGSLTPHIDNAFDPQVDNIILDGEMLVWDPVSERNLPFGTLKTAALDKSKKEHNPRPCCKLLNIVLYKTFHSTFRRIEFVKEYRGRTAKEIRSRMDDIVANRGEGLVIKHPNAKYILNGRNMDWVKVKPEYMDNMGETVDVLVVAGNYGTGKRAGGVSTLVCAVLDDRHSNDDDGEPKYSTFVRIGSGLSFADYVWIRSKPWKVWDPKHPPEFLQTAKRSHDDKGDVYLEPEDSFILKVKAAEVTPSDQYHIGFTMRFPRALSIRDDLSIADCMPASAVFESIRSEKKRKMESDIGVSTKKKKTVVKKPTMLPEYSGGSLKSLRVESNLFSGMTFVVMSDPKSRTGDQDKNTWMALIHKHGGKCAQIVRNQENLFIVYDGTVTPYDLKLIINKGIHDIVRPSWVEDSVAIGRLVPLRKKYFFHATEARMAEEHYGEDEKGKDENYMDEELSVGTPLETNHLTSKIGERVEELDPDLSEWFEVNGNKYSENEQKKDEDSATENDSDNADVAAEDPDLDDWFSVDDNKLVTRESSTSDSSFMGSPRDSVEIRMGESETAMDYDAELIFRHLCFYLDTPVNARNNGMIVKSKHEDDISASFAKISDLIVQNGGKLSGLDEPKLTHIVVDKRDESRRLDLMKQTSKPKRRHIVVSEYITACIQEETLLDEDDFSP
ncbi:DNA ligase 4 [Cyathus striatus]|nr:DNA ligase 4 [Cyathus striatus]